MTNANISCLICTHRAPSSIDALLKSLKEQHWDEGDEIILIDNGISPGRLADLEPQLDELRRQGAKVVVEREERPGLTQARLRSFTLARSPWLFLLDDDNLLAPDALERIRECLRLHPGLGGICPQIQPLWPKAAPNWLIALGHQVLSYNSSALARRKCALKVWKPGMVGAQPPGGGMIVCRRAAQEFVTLAGNNPTIRSLGRTGSNLAAGEDFVVYSAVYRLRLPTAYDHSILVYHQIAPERMEFTYILRLLYSCNFSYGILALLRFGKWNAGYALARGIARLAYEVLPQFFKVRSWRILVAFIVALWGYYRGIWAGFLSRSGEISSGP